MLYKPQMIDCKFALDELQKINYALTFVCNGDGGIDFIRSLYDDDNLTDDEIKYDLIRIKGLISGFGRMASAEKTDEK